MGFGNAARSNGYFLPILRKFGDSSLIAIKEALEGLELRIVNFDLEYLLDRHYCDASCRETVTWADPPVIL